MFEQFNLLRSLVKQARPKLEAYLDESEITALEEEIAQRTQDQQPVVMVYGVYNSGKSTLINALAGKKLAEMAEIPKTDRVDAYQLGLSLIHI